ncbi:MAG: hypothetical protein QM711_18065 [Micropruina sp.]|uniref:hypothetical protein n=1 Tax=Micropruina sp. TaxID=2737536 RepID=UPI0039E6B193
MITKAPVAVPDAAAAAVGDPEAPFRRPGEFGRRSMLAGLLGVGVGLYLNGSSFATPVARAATPRPAPGRFGAINGPNAVAASCELTDDVFSTADVLIGADDELLPFFNPTSGVTEALVFSNGSLNHLHRDPTQATGWAYAQFDLQGVFTSVTDVAIAANDERVYALIFGSPDPQDNPDGSPYWLTWLNDATSWNQGFVADVAYADLPHDPGPLKGGVSTQGQPYFYTTVAAPAPGGGQSTQLVAWVANGSDTDPLDFYPLLTPHNTKPVQDVLVLFDTASQNTVGSALVLNTDGTLSVYAQVGPFFDYLPMTVIGGISQLLWAWTPPNSSTGQPGAAFQGEIDTLGGEGTFFLDGTARLIRLADAPASGPNSVVVWSRGDLYTVNLLDDDGNLACVHETSQGSWAAPLSLTSGVPGSPQPGLVGVFGVPFDPTQATLFAVGADETLSVLTLDDTGWTQTQVRQNASDAVPMTCYRLTISLLDSVGNPVRNGQAQVGTDRLVGLWQDVGSTILIPGSPVTLTADLRGQIVLSVPAEELDSAVLTVQALDDNGRPSGSPLSVAGDYDVRNFLGGSAPLTDLGTLQAGTLTSATADGKPLLPGLHPGDAGALVTTLAAAVTAGRGQAPAAGRPRAFRLERHAGRLRAASSADAKKFGVTTVAAASLGTLFHSLGHALRHGLAKVQSAVIRWADDLKQWVVDLATDLSELATYAINDMRDAFHVIGGWFSTLGADIVKMVNWLKREMLELLTSVGQNATTIGTMLSAGATQLGGIIGGVEKQVDTWFSDQEATVNGWISDLSKAIEQATFGQSQPPTPPPSDTGSSTALTNVSSNFQWIMKVANDCPGMWLYHKLSQYLPVDPGPDLTGVFDGVLQDLTAAWKDSVDLGATIVQTLWTSLKDIASKDDMTEQNVSEWFGYLQAIVDDVLDLCNKIADAVLDFTLAALAILDRYLAYQWSIPSVDPVLKLITDELHVDATISLNRLISLSVALPVTLVRVASGHNPVFKPSAAAAATSDDGDSYCYLVAAVSQAFCLVADVIGDVQLLVPEGGEVRPQQSGIIDYFDIICPLLQTILTMPGRDGNLIWNGLPTDTNEPGLLPPAIYTAVMTPLFKIADKAKPTASPDPDTINYYDKAPAAADPLSQYYGPLVSSLSAAANCVLSARYGYVNTDNKTDAILGAVFGNTSNLVSPFTTWWLNVSTEDAAVAIKAVIDIVGGVGACVMYGKSA